MITIKALAAKASELWWKKYPNDPQVQSSEVAAWLEMGSAYSDYDLVPDDMAIRYLNGIQLDVDMMGVF